MERQYTESLDTSGRGRGFSDSLGTSADDLQSSEVSNDPRALGIMVEGSEGEEEGEERSGAGAERTASGEERSGDGSGAGTEFRSPHRSVRSGASGRGAGAGGFHTPSAHYFAANDASMTVKRRRQTPRA